MTRDIRYALRGLKRQWGFATMAILTLAVGIGGAATLFSFVDAWILRPLPYTAGDRLIFGRELQLSRGSILWTSWANYRDLQAQSRAFDRLAAASMPGFTLTMDGLSERIGGVQMTVNFLETLGVRPTLGRNFRPEEEKHGNHRVALVSHGFWQARLGGEASALGRKLRLDGEDYEVIGILPARFHFPMFGRANVFVPLAPAPDRVARRGDRFLSMVGRLAPGVTLDHARQEAASIAQRLAASYPESNASVGFSLTPLTEEIGRHTGNEIIAIVFAVALALTLIACVNVGNLLLARAVNRSRQAAIQLSLGATTGQLVRQSLVESTVLFLMAGLLSAFLGAWGTDLVAGFIPIENRDYLPNFGVVSFSLRGFVFAVGLAGLLGVVFGLLPALRWARPGINVTLRENGSALSASRGQSRLQGGLVVSQVLVATLVVSATGMLVEGARNRWAAPPGFRIDSLVTARVSLNEKGYADPARRQRFWRSVEDELSPRGAVVSQTIPFDDDQRWVVFRAPGVTLDDASLPTAHLNAVGERHLAQLGIPLIEGRGFSRQDENAAFLPLIVNQSFARVHLAGRHPIGQRIAFPRWRNQTGEVIGIVGDIRSSVEEKPGEPQVYVPLALSPPYDAVIAIRSADTDATAREVRQAIARLDPDQPVFNIKTIEERKTEQDAGYRLLTHLLEIFGGMTLVLATIGVYGVVSYSVSRRKREFGIRAALGADHAALTRLVIGQGWRLFLLGFVPGLAAAIALTPALRNLVAQYLDDLRFFSAGPLLFALAVAVATWLPARRAAATDPVRALRSE